MTPDGKRKFNTLVGSLFLLLGVGGWAMTGYLVLTPAPPKPHPVSLAPKVDANSCRIVLQRLGYETTVRKDEVVAIERGLSDPEDQLRRASLAISACKIDLKEFCMGTSCEPEGLTFTLSNVVSDGKDVKAARPSGAERGRPNRPERPNLPAKPPATAPAGAPAAG